MTDFQLFLDDFTTLQSLDCLLQFDFIDHRDLTEKGDFHNLFVYSFNRLPEIIIKSRLLKVPLRKVTSNLKS